MVRLNEHRNKMQELHDEIKHAKGIHKKDLLRQYNRMAKELRECEMHLRGDYGRRLYGKETDPARAG